MSCCTVYVPNSIITLYTSLIMIYFFCDIKKNITEVTLMHLPHPFTLFPPYICIFFSLLFWRGALETKRQKKYIENSKTENMP